METVLEFYGGSLVLDLSQTNWQSILKKEVRRRHHTEPLTCKHCIQNAWDGGFCFGLSVAFIILYRDADSFKLSMDTIMFPDIVTFYQIRALEVFNHNNPTDDFFKTIAPIDIHLTYLDIKISTKLSMIGDQSIKELTGALLMHTGWLCRIDIYLRTGAGHSFALWDKKDEQEIIFFDSNHGIGKLTGPERAFMLPLFIMQHVVLNYPKHEGIESWNATFFKRPEYKS